MVQNAFDLLLMRDQSTILSPALIILKIVNTLKSKFHNNMSITFMYLWSTALDKGAS